jgi:hypothetical protein
MELFKEILNTPICGEFDLIVIGGGQQDVVRQLAPQEKE